MTFQSPFFLFALLVVFAVLLLAYFVTRRNARYPVTFTNLGVLAEIVPARRRAWKRLVAPLLLALALAFAAGALAHPTIRLTKPDQNATIVLLVDVSGSMRANDVEPTRLDAAINAMRTFLDRLPKQFKVGLVAFSSEPEPLITPTSNRDGVQGGDLAARARGRHRCGRWGRGRVEDGHVVATAGRLRSQARPGGSGRDRLALRRRPEPRAPAAAPGREDGEERRNPHLSGLARDAER